MSPSVYECLLGHGLTRQDAMGVARNVLKDAKLVPGGGASEMAVSSILKKKSMSIEGVEQVRKSSFVCKSCLCVAYIITTI